MPDPRKLFVGGLPKEVLDEEIQCSFIKFGFVEHVNIPKHPDGCRMGFCIITFSTQEEAEACLHANDHHIFDSKAGKDKRVQVKPWEPPSGRNPKRKQPLRGDAAPHRTGKGEKGDDRKKRSRQGKGGRT
jgi:RNA recognition motif-containing protein